MLYKRAEHRLSNSIELLFEEFLQCDEKFRAYLRVLAIKARSRGIQVIEEEVYDTIMALYLQFQTGELSSEALANVDFAQLSSLEAEAIVRDILDAYILASLEKSRAREVNIDFTDASDDYVKYKLDRVLSHSPMDDLDFLTTLEDAEVYYLLRLVGLLDKGKTQKGYSLWSLLMHSSEIEAVLNDWVMEVSNYYLSENSVKYSRVHKGQGCTLRGGSVHKIRDYKLLDFSFNWKSPRAKAEYDFLVKKLGIHGFRGLFSAISLLMAEINRDKDRVLRIGKDYGVIPI